MAIVAPVIASARISDDFQFNYTFNSNVEGSNVSTICSVAFTHPLMKSLDRELHSI